MRLPLEDRLPIGLAVNPKRHGEVHAPARQPDDAWLEVWVQACLDLDGRLVGLDHNVVTLVKGCVTEVEHRQPAPRSGCPDLAISGNHANVQTHGNPRSERRPVPSDK